MEDVSDTGTVQRIDDGDKPQVPRAGGRAARGYDSTLRQARAQQTREAILASGRTLFVAHGYARTTMRAIATHAGVALETIYLHFRSKPALLKTLLDIAVGGDETGVPVADREWVRWISAAPDIPATLTRFATEVAAVHARLAPLFIAVRAAAEADHHAAELWSARKHERFEGMDRFARHLIASGATRAECTSDQIRDELFTLASPEVYGLLVLELGWTADHYVHWLTCTLTQRLLLGPQPHS